MLLLQNLSKLEPDVEPARCRRRALAEQRSHVCDLKRGEAVDGLRPRPRPLRERVHVVQQHGLSRHRLKLLKDLDAVLDGDATLGPPRRDDLDHHVAHLPSLDVLQKALKDRGFGALGVHLDERDVPPVLEDGVREDDAAAGGGREGGAFTTTTANRTRDSLQALVPQGAVADVLGVVFHDIGLLAQAQVEEVHAARQARVVSEVLPHPGEARVLQLEAVHGRAVRRGEQREEARVDPDVDDGKGGRVFRSVWLFVNRRRRILLLCHHFILERLFKNVLDLTLDAALEKALFQLVVVRGGERELFMRARGESNSATRAINITAVAAGKRGRRRVMLFYSKEEEERTIFPRCGKG